MRIIKDNTETIIACGFCGSKFAFSKKDVLKEKEFNPQPSIYVDTYSLYVECPCCDWKNYIKRGQ